jgi:ABC-type multidrug transport system fused ATPase/permease subunit
MRELTALKRKGDVVDALLADHGLFHLEADLRWIDMTAARLPALGEVVDVMSAASGSDVVLVGDTVLEARDLALSFGETPALRGASVAVKKGEVLAVMGPSGSGKSTLLHCLAGILVPDSGEIYVDGQRLDTMSEKERSALRRDRFGFVFQFGQLVPELTAEENVALPLLLGGVRREEALRWRGPGSNDSISTAWSVIAPARCPAGRRSASLWRVAWSPILRCSSPTNRRDHSTR